MCDHARYAADENVKRFEALLRSGRLESGQIDTVRALLVQARRDLAELSAAPGTLRTVAEDPGSAA